MEGEREEEGRKEGKVHVKVNWQNLGIDYLGKSQREGRETNKMQTWAIKNLIANTVLLPAFSRLSVSVTVGLRYYFKTPTVQMRKF